MLTSLCSLPFPSSINRSINQSNQLKHHYLSEHPGIYPFRLDGNDETDGKNFNDIGNEKHAAAYDGAADDRQLVGDAAVSRLVNDAERLRTHCGAGASGSVCSDSLLGALTRFADAGPRFIVLLREPVDVRKGQTRDNTKNTRNKCHATHALAVWFRFRFCHRMSVPRLLSCSPSSS